MAWLRIDDGFSRHPKVTALTHKERWIWIDILCFCARYSPQGFLPENIKELVVGITDKYLQKCVDLELLDDVTGDGLQVHDWLTYAPKDPTGAERQAAWRNKNRNSRVTEGAVTKPSLARDTPAGTARVPVPSPKNYFLGR